MARASRTSEPAAQPAAAPAPAAPAAPAARVPEFAAPASPEQPVVTKWDSYSADEGGMPAEPSTPVAVADQRDKVKINADGVPVDEAPAELQSLRDQLRPEIPAEPAAEPETQEPAKPKTSARRRAVLDALAGETRLRGLEGQLQTERAERARTDRLLREGSLGEILLARGIEPDAALEQLSTGTYGKPPEAQAEDLPPAVKELRDEVNRLKAQNAEAQRAAGLSAVEREVMAIEAAPVVHAAIRSGAIVDNDAKTGQPLTASELISRAALARWRAAGAVQGEQQKYIQEATEVLEEILIERHEPIVQAIAKKRGAAPAAPDAARPATPATPGIGKRIAARPDAKPRPLPIDVEARDIEIKKRYGWA